MDIVEKSDQDSETLIANYQRLRKEQTPAFAALLAERDRRAAGKDQLDLALSLEALKAAAKEHRYVTYGDLSQASGQTWNHTIRARMSGPNGHLDRMSDICHQRGLPCSRHSALTRKTGRVANSMPSPEQVFPAGQSVLASS
jgi:hypothetical protein